MSTFEELAAQWENDTLENKFVQDGKYTAKVTVFLDHNDGTDIIKFRYYFPSLNVSETELLYVSEKTLTVMKAKLLALGLDAKKASDIPIEFMKVKDWTVEIEKKTNGKYRNYYVNNVVSKTPSTQEAKEPEVVAAEAPLADDEFPF